MAKKKENIVYRYRLKETGEIIYVGKTDASLKARVDAHEKEEKFLPYKGKWEIEYINLANFVETDVVEKYLINKLKPVLNEKDCIPKVSNILTITLPAWKKYLDYPKIDSAKYAVLYTEAVAKENLVRALWVKDKACVPHLPTEPIWVPNGIEMMPVQIIKPTIVRENNRFLVEASEEWMENKEARQFPNRILCAIWEPVANKHCFSEENEKELLLCKRARCLVHELYMYLRDGFDQGLSFEKGVFETENYAEELDMFGFDNLIFSSIKGLSDSQSILEVPPFDERLLEEILENISALQMTVYAKTFILTGKEDLYEI